MGHNYPRGRFTLSAVTGRPLKRCFNNSFLRLDLWLRLQPGRIWKPTQQDSPRNNAKAVNIFLLFLPPQKVAEECLRERKVCQVAHTSKRLLVIRRLAVGNRGCKEA